MLPQAITVNWVFLVEKERALSDSSNVMKYNGKQGVYIFHGWWRWRINQVVLPLWSFLLGLIEDHADCRRREKVLYLSISSN